MAHHAVEIVDDTNGYCLVCTCGEEITGSTLEEAGRKFDEHLAANWSQV